MSSIILIIDDEVIARESLEALLAGEGYQLEFAVNGPEGLARAGELAPDVILLDVMMPGMDGFEVCRRLRADARLAEVPVLIITALDDRESRLEGMRAGADDFISKPFDSLELSIRLQAMTRLNRYRRLLAERTRLAWVLERAWDGYVILDVHDHFLYANPQARLYLNLPAGEAPLADPFLEVARRHYRLEPESAWAGWPDITRSKTPCCLVRPETATAQVFWLQVEQFQTVAEGGRVFQLRDVTRQIAARGDVRKFHNMFSHKLLTPLSHIYTGLELLAHEAPFMPAAEVSNFAAQTFQGAKRLRAEIDDVLLYITAPVLAKPEEGFGITHLEALAQTIGGDLKCEALTVQVAEELHPCRLALSPQAIELILWEALENAKKFHPQKKPRVEVQIGRAYNGLASLRIQDDGLSLSPEQLAWAWTPYVQGEKYFTGELPGMGLGLSLVAALVWQVGGKVNLANRPDGKPGVVAELFVPLQ